MLTVKAEVQRDKLRRDGTYNVKIRFTKGKQVKRVSSNLFVTKKDLTKDYKLRVGTTMQKEAEMIVLRYREKLLRLDIDEDSYSLDAILSMIRYSTQKSMGVDFILFCRTWIKNAPIKGAANYTTALNAFIRYIGKDSLNTKDITTDLVEGFKDFLLKEHLSKVDKLEAEGKRVPSNRSLSLYLMSIRHLFNEAKRHYNNPDNGIKVISSSPFDNIRIPRQEATRKRAITPEQIRKIWKLSYQTTCKGYKHTNRFNLAKDCFILSFCLMGMNSVDLFNATELEDGVITYYRTKTRARRLDDAKMQVKVPKFIYPLIEKYKDSTGHRIFNFYQTYANDKAFNKALNYGLKQIGALLKIDDLEYYAARHSWATIAINKVGIDKYTVHEALNHVDESMRVTDIYIERDFVNENKANAKVLKYVFGKITK